MKYLRYRGFTLIEMLLVLAVVALLSSLLLPVIGAVRGKAREVSCASNLHQIGQSFTMYMQDYDGRFPNAVDPVDRAAGQWNYFPAFQSDIPHLPMLHDVLQPYTSSRTLFHCPSDTGFGADDFASAQIDAFPTCFDKYGTSYCYRTELAARRKHESEVANPTAINMVQDPFGDWHGTLTPPAKRYNVLFADGHVKNLPRQAMNDAWNTPLTLTP